jgi:hypothetical protein
MFDAPLDRGDAATAWRLARHLKRGALSLDYALALLLLITDDAGRYERATARWLQRWDNERTSCPATQRAQLAHAIDELPGLEGITQLAKLCETLELPRAGATLIHLYPTLPGPHTARASTA